MKQKILIYDFDGVICDSVHIKTEAFVELYAQYDEKIQQAVKAYHLKHGGISRYEKFNYFETELLGKPPTKERIEELAQAFTQLVKEKVIASSYLNGILPFLEKHKNEALQFICTGTPETEILEITKRKKIDHLFTAIYGSPESKTRIIQNILQETGAQPEDCLFFGDAMTDLNAAKECNIPFVGIENKDTQFPKTTFIINDFIDIKLLNRTK
jgi:HAD superfamily hydrolase (TIGR01509 family)